MKRIYVSTPSRLCLFGEHQDYLGLEVIACAINLRFSARIQEREDKIIHISIRDSKIDTLGMINTDQLYETFEINLEDPIIYRNNRDYLKSSVNILLKQGIPLHGFSIKMDSEIPIGKGMCSSSTMIVVLIKALLEGMEHPLRNDMEKIAHLAFQAEVEEFDEPGGMMDHYVSALGGFVNLDFEGGKTTPSKIKTIIPGCFILFDSKEQKNTTAVLASAKIPTIKALEQINLNKSKFSKLNGISSTAELFINDFDLAEFQLEEQQRKVLQANKNNYRILLEAKAMLNSGNIDDVRFGALLSEHHCNLRDGLGVSTATIEIILKTAIEQGALGGKVNGSGGGGCCFVYAKEEDEQRILKAVLDKGYPGKILKQDTGLRVDSVEEIVNEKLI